MKIVASGSYLPKKMINNAQIEEKLDLENGYIFKRTGIQKRFFLGEEETIETIAIEAVKKLFLSIPNNDKQKIGLIVCATTTPKQFMPGISNKIQKEFGLQKAICFDILAGCNGFVNAFDLAHLYIKQGNVEQALVIGVDALSQYTEFKNTDTSILLSDGAGAVLLEKTNENKTYESYIESIPDEKDILTCGANEKIQMKGKEIYKYAVSKPVQNVKELLKLSEGNLQDIAYLIPHQSNQKIINAIASRLEIEKEKVYSNIETTGNTFCASIPIALDEMFKNNLLKDGDKIILLGYGGGLNTGSILLEI